LEEVVLQMFAPSGLMREILAEPPAGLDAKAVTPRPRRSFAEAVKV
jgi:hypothetical protein